MDRKTAVTLYRDAETLREKEGATYNARFVRGLASSLIDAYDLLWAVVVLHGDTVNLPFDLKHAISHFLLGNDNIDCRPRLTTHESVFQTGYTVRPPQP